MKADRKQPETKDPVCGMLVSPKTAAVEARHDGKTYYFCADICREMFEADPEKYLRWHKAR